MTASGPPALPDEGRPSGASLPANLEPLAETARAYARAATSQNTNRAYAAGWRDYLRWRARQGLDLKPLADPECVGLYCAAMASGATGGGGKARTVATIERRLSALVWNFAQRALPFDRKDRHVATVLAGVRAHPWLAARPEGGAAAGACPWPCSTSSPRRAYATCATGRSSSSASPAAFAAPRSPAS